MEKWCQEVGLSDVLLEQRVTTITDALIPLGQSMNACMKKFSAAHAEYNHRSMPNPSAYDANGWTNQRYNAEMERQFGPFDGTLYLLYVWSVVIVTLWCMCMVHFTVVYVLFVVVYVYDALWYDCVCIYMVSYRQVRTGYVRGQATTHWSGSSCCGADSNASFGTARVSS